MGSTCCVAARERALPKRTDSETLHSNLRYSPSWSFRWDNRGRVAGEVENPINQFPHGISRNVGLEMKEQRDMETEHVSDGGSPTETFHTPMWQKSPVHEGTTGSLRTPTSDLSIGSNFSTEVKHSTESTTLANPSLLELSLSVPSVSSSSISKADSFSESHADADSMPLRQARRSPGHQLFRQVSDSRILGFKSPNNNSVSEGRQSFVLSMCSNDLTMSSNGGSSDGWSMRTFSELVASSQRERWSFDSDTLGYGHGKITRSNSHCSASPSTDLQTCGICSKLLTERSSWSTQKIIATNELSVVAILVCGHVYHAECLENMTPETDRYDPSCPVCMAGEKQILKIAGKASRMEADLKLKNYRVSKNRIVDSDLDDNFIVSDHRKSAGKEGKGPKMGTSSGMKSFGGPFLRRHFSLGSKTTRPLSASDSARKGFWARYRKE
ncbi:PREDICTED: uncharacterized protein LOC104610574 [Nelumbo nucifera]|uniref:Uncharacterized protein LOC104610574 n=1 Tax=Nelumbo nucifera TaxID=4432 RepID=A0A1U8Q9N7_NELNU|nr:PREDICTED: uncharacterized protein LOC104610574 [Nelumbo nucifera]XP_019055504.1 PREDICTED: uncharacterized protein LOC104610574 [Nelumbo nucifera]XP_019055505.1 PREDICTED: uncharacterized protein LOC104610574 [Nelumbo nucifera]XP_019055506.1 PREDICTED: uncharacterized protein LOC104610574 [Nelumbo nucifera]XP_019055507.1 PREDICTED: uncharacterized protein LOC104610574 [Nelumbo nucifera]XP_019055508.1 PREDICTED: uncharacterized protein LOC104610574 [Nelumbo nucifera]XP_019055509.1 PREDICTE